LFRELEVIRNVGETLRNVVFYSLAHEAEKEYDQQQTHGQENEQISIEIAIKFPKNAEFFGVPAVIFRSQFFCGCFLAGFCFIIILFGVAKAHVGIEVAETLSVLVVEGVGAGRADIVVFSSADPLGKAGEGAHRSVFLGAGIGDFNGAALYVVGLHADHT
jgi:hypothetical protein